jgi:prepilin-type N-terminal cleavage/methylation domain-containing protein
MRGSQALTLLEIILVVAILGIALAIGAVRLNALGDPLGGAASKVEGTFKQVRAKAMSTTSAYRVSRVSATVLRAEYAVSCSDTSGWTVDPKFDATLENGVQMTAPTANGEIVCFDSRGIADANPTVALTDAKGGTASVEVFLGGAVEVHR